MDIAADLAGSGLTGNLLSDALQAVKLTADRR
jgi:hypothetical protein